MLIVLTFITIGAVVGIGANLTEVYSFSDKMLQSVALGIAGATGGGYIGELYSDFVFYTSPFIFAFIGAAILVMMPRKGNILD